MRLFIFWATVFSGLLGLWYLAVAWIQFDLAWGVILADKINGLDARVGYAFIAIICLTVSLGVTMAFKEIMEDLEDLED